MAMKREKKKRLLSRYNNAAQCRQCTEITTRVSDVHAYT